MKYRHYLFFKSFFHCFLLLASQSNLSLKKQRSRSIFSTFFCCFRNYNVEPPVTNTSSTPPPVEENGSPPKVRGSISFYKVSEIEVWTFVSLSAYCQFLSIVSSVLFLVLLLNLFMFSSNSHLIFVCVSISLCCSVTKSRSCLSLVYVLRLLLFFLHAGRVSQCIQILWTPMFLLELWFFWQ